MLAGVTLDVEMLLSVGFDSVVIETRVGQRNQGCELPVDQVSRDLSLSLVKEWIMDSNGNGENGTDQGLIMLQEKRMYSASVDM